VIIRAEKELESLLDRILRGRLVILPSNDFRTIAKLSLVLQPVRRKGGIYFGRDGKARKTLIIATVKVVEKRRKGGIVEYLLGPTFSPGLLEFGRKRDFPL
jgi:hypothetical protein